MGRQGDLSLPECTVTCVLLACHTPTWSCGSQGDILLSPGCGPLKISEWELDQKPH